jgi:hypothetical protein
MATTLIDNNKGDWSVCQLDTYTLTTSTTAAHVCKVMVTEIPPSGITVTIKQNASTIASTSAPAASQGVINLSATMPITSGDTISVVLASSTASDQSPNSFKANINIHRGSLN